MKKRWILWFLILMGVAAGAIWRGNAARTGAAPAERGVNEGTRVVVAKAARQDVPVWLSGIGTARASNTVTVRPRVSGSLDKVNFREGAMVDQGEVLAEIDSRPYRSALAQAEAKMAQDEAQLANARLEASRFRNLLKTNAVSIQQFDQAEATVLQLEALAQADQAAVQAAQLDLDFTTVRAPIAGRTGVRLVDAGNIVTANQEAGLVVLTQVQPMAVVFTLPQKHLPALATKMRKGDPAPLVQASSESGVALAEGTLELIDNQIETTTGTLRLKAVFTNDEMTLWPGQFVSARVLADTLEAAIVVPAEAVMAGLDGQFCYVVNPDNTVEARTVVTGLGIDGGIVIGDGLEAGETVVVTGQGKLKPGARVVAEDLKP